MTAKIDENGNGPAPSEQDERPIVKGDRICLRCKGICHEDSIRQRGKQGTGGRAHYFCSMTCLRLYYELEFYQDYERIMKRHGRMDEYEAEMSKMAKKTFASRYEFVDVITL